MELEWVPAHLSDFVLEENSISQIFFQWKTEKDSVLEGPDREGACIYCNTWINRCEFY